MIPAEMSKILSEAFLEFESSIPVLFFILFIILEQRVGFSDSAGRVLFWVKPYINLLLSNLFPFT